MNNFQKLLNLAKTLRSRHGCPWDRKQTIQSLLDNIIEEAQEVKEAGMNKDYKNLKEEIGDLIFNLIMITQIAEEKKLFEMEDVLKDIEKKIIKRHSWVFGKDKAKTPEQAIKLWHENKKREKK